MTWHSDPKAFEQTAAIKRGEQNIDPAYEKLACWLEKTYRGVSVLNFFYDPPRARTPPRLGVVFDRKADADRFSIAPLQYNKSELDRIAANYKRLVGPRPYVETEGLFAIPFSFEEEARERATLEVTDDDLLTLQAGIDDPTLWLIRMSFEVCVFFFHTDAQLQASERSGARGRCASAYAAVLSRYDEFGYFRVRAPSVRFDSAENFQRVYRGRWWAYDH